MLLKILLLTLFLMIQVAISTAIQFFLIFFLRFQTAMRSFQGPILISFQTSFLINIAFVRTDYLV